MKLGLYLSLSAALVGFALAAPTGLDTDIFDKEMTLDETLAALKELDRQFTSKEREVHEEGFDDIVRLCIDAVNVSADKCNNDKAFELQNLYALRWGSKSLEAYIKHYADLQFELCRKSVLENSEARFNKLSAEQQGVLYRLVTDIADEGKDAGNDAYSMEYYEYVPDKELAHGLLKFMKKRAFRSWDQVDEDDIEQLVGKLCEPFRDSTVPVFQHLGPMSARTGPLSWSPIAVERVCRQIFKQKPTLVNNMYLASVSSPKFY